MSYANNSSSNSSNNSSSSSSDSRLVVAKKRMSNKQNNGLFSKFLITQLDLTTYKPLIAFKWLPKGTQDSKDEADENKVQQFCFPESTSVLQSIITNITTEQIDYFSFILTNSYGGKSFAYCKRILKEDPVCYIFISTKPYFSLFDQIFTVIESKYERKVKYSINALLTSLLSYPLDHSLAQTEIKASANNSQTENYEFLYTCPASEFEHISYEPLFHIRPAHIIKLFESILTECRVILCSSSISKISNSILAISSLVYPFAWQHIFISILPESLMPYVSAPIPFLVGILESSLKSFYQQPTEQVILYNLDKCEFMIDPNFKSLLPVHINTYLENSLKKIKSEHPTYDSSFDKVIRKPFLSVIFHLFQNYPKFMTKNGVNYSFQKDQFIDSHSGSNKKLIETLVCSQMIEMFFNEKEVELSKSDDPQQCSFLLESKHVVDKIQVTSYKRQSVLDCPICMQSTNHHASIEFANYLMHQECFKCKTCGRGLMDLEREKVILKRKDGERIQLYCAECRSGTFLNKLKSTSSQSKQKIYSFFKNLDSEDVNSSFFYSSPAIRYSRQQHQLQQMQQQLQQQTRGVNISNPVPLYASNTAGGSGGGGYPVIPVKTEIHNYKFKKPPPKDLGGKQLSLGRLHNEKSSTLPGALNRNNMGEVQQRQYPPKVSSSSFNKSLPDRQKPPLPPTPGEMKERAVEQFKQKNIHLHGFDYEQTSSSSMSPSPSTGSNTPSVSPSTSFDESRLHNHLETTTTSTTSSANSTPSNTPPPQSSSLVSQISIESRVMQFSKALPELPSQPNKKASPLPPLPPIPTTPTSSRPLPIPPSKEQGVGYSPSISPSSTSPRRGGGPNQHRGHSPPHTTTTSTAPIHQPYFVPIKKPLPIPKSPSVNDVPLLLSTPTITTTTNTSTPKPPSPTTPKLNPTTPSPTPSPPTVREPKQPDRQPHNNNHITNNNNHHNTTTTTTAATNPKDIVYTNNVIIPTNNYYTNSRTKPASPRTYTNPTKPPTPRGGNNSSNSSTSVKSHLSPTSASSSSSSSTAAHKSPLSSPDSSLSPRRLNKHCFLCKVPLVATDELIVSDRKYYHYDCFEKDKASRQCATKQPLHGEYHNGCSFKSDISATTTV